MTGPNDGLIDLHLHSIYSDGVLEPREIVRRCHSRSVAILSLTDHDAVAGVKEAEAEAERLGLGFISGVELSTTFRGFDIHMLGYEIDVTRNSLLASLDLFAKKRRERADKIVRRLRGQGLSINLEDVLKIAGPGPSGRPHIAEALVRAGEVRAFEDAFRYYIGRQCPAYVPKHELSPADAVHLIHEAGGVAVLAHPLAGPQSREDVMALLDSGLDGLEVIHPMQEQSESKWLRDLAGQKGLIITGGSDYHGGDRSQGEMGVELRLCSFPLKKESKNV